MLLGSKLQSRNNYFTGTCWYIIFCLLMQKDNNRREKFERSFFCFCFCLQLAPFGKPMLKSVVMPLLHITVGSTITPARCQHQHSSPPYQHRRPRILIKTLQLQDMHTAFQMHNTSSGPSLCIQLSPVVGQTTNGWHDRGRKYRYPFVGKDELKSETGRETELRVCYKFGDTKKQQKLIYFHDLTALVGLGLLKFEVSRSHSDTLQ